ncbi:hypothetical protein CKO36_13650 [Rhabdochromatium marinum]|nr:hypothetical protein [Rhabdochromatium marinum]
MNNLSRILYISRASIGVGDDKFNKILYVFRKNNRERDITGILCGGGGHFIQVLEGPQAELFRLYGKILEDRRHYDSVVIGVAPIEERIFSDWAMGYMSSPGRLLGRFTNRSGCFSYHCFNA